MASPQGRLAPGVFISYRRDDNSRWARRLAPALRERIGDHRVSLDIDYETGRDWREQIKERLDAAFMVVVLIGPDFLSLKDDAGRLRLELPDDYVRQEIRGALLNDKLVVPVLTDQAQAPKDRDLPEDIRPLAYLQADRLDTTKDLDPICDRIERRLNTGQTMRAGIQGHLDPAASPLGRPKPRHKDPKILRSLRTAALNELITAGWDIDNQAGGMLAVHDGHPRYRFRFDNKQPVIWLEEDANANPGSPNWKRVKSFGLSPAPSTKKAAGLEVSQLASAATNPTAFLGREGKTPFDSARAAMAKAFVRPPVSVDWLRDALERNRSHTSAETEQRSRAAEGLRRAARGIHLELHRDLDLGADTVSGIQFSESSDSLAIACWYKLCIDAGLTADSQPLNREYESSIETMRWSIDGRLALGMDDGDIVLLSADGTEQRAPHLDASWRRITESQRFAHAINALGWSADGKGLFYSSGRFPLVYWIPGEGRTAEVELPLPSKRNKRGEWSWYPDEMWESLTDNAAERLANWAGASYKGRLNLVVRGPAMAIGDKSSILPLLERIIILDGYGRDGQRSIQYGRAVRDLAYSPDGALLAVGSEGARLDVIPVLEPEARKSLTGHDPISADGIGEPDVIGVAFSPDGRFLASIGEDKNLILWHTGDWSMGAALQLSWHGRLSSTGPLVTWSRNSEYLAVPWEGSRVRVFRVRQGG